MQTNPNYSANIDSYIDVLTMYISIKKHSVLENK